MLQYDVIVIGSGTAGQSTAYELAAEGYKVAVIEQSDRPGGVCALRGCQAKKWFYEVTETVARSRHLKNIGIVTPPEFSWQQILSEKNKFTAQIPEDTVKNLRGNGIEFLEGEVKFINQTTLQKADTIISSDFIVVASGAHPVSLPFNGNEHLITSDDFLELTELPRRIAFVGGGFISFEFAHFAARLGSSFGNIHIIEATSQPLASFDAEMVNLLVKASEAEGIRFHLSASVSSISRQERNHVVTLSDGNTLEVDLVVNAAGRAPTIKGLNLDAAGVKYDDKGIEVDSSMRTSNPKVFAVGDCAGTLKLARVADREAYVAAGTIIAAREGGESPAIDYSAVPAMLFTYPQLGMVGKTEEALKKEGVRYWKSFDKELSFPTYRRVGMKHAAYKILVDENDLVLGAHFLADNATGLVNTFKQAMLDKTPIGKLRQDNIMSPYPSRESDIIYMLAPLLE